MDSAWNGFSISFALGEELRERERGRAWDSLSWENKQRSVIPLRKKMVKEKGKVSHPLASFLCLHWLCTEQGLAAS